MPYILLLAAVLVGYVHAEPLSKVCGKPAIFPNLPRVVGGNEAKPNSWPWQVQLRYNGNHWCGGSILSPDWILTAAHCVYGRTALSFSVRAGRHTRSGSNQASDKYEQVSFAKDLISHEAYVSSNMNNDIALIRLTSKFTYNNQVSPICLTSADPAGGTAAYLSGWGNVQGTCCDGKLKQAYLPIVDRKKCQTSTYWGSRVSPGMVCAGHDNAAQGGCNGDSGGPLVTLKDNTFYQVGVVSWGSKSCTQAYKPTVFANVNFYKSWITSRVVQLEAEEAVAASKKFHPRLGAAFASRWEEEVDESQF